MPATYEPIATTTLGSSAVSYTFSSIPTTYTDLRLVLIGAITSAGQDFYFQVGNGSVDTGTNYSTTFLHGNGTAVGSSRLNTRNQGYFDWSGQSTTAGNSMVTADFMNYSNTTTFKTVLSRTGTASISTEAVVNLWRSTSAINTVKIFASGGNLQAGSMLTLYGIKAA
jgi:hypothetical protein